MNRLDRIMRAFSLLSLAFLIFSAGMVVSHFKIWPYELYHFALEGGKAWQDKQRMIAENPLLRGRPVSPDRPRGVMKHDKEKAFAGVTVATLPQRSRAQIIDNDGRVIFQWGLLYGDAFEDAVGSCPENRIYWTAVHPYANGDLLAIYECDAHTPPGHGMVKLDRQSRILWKAPIMAHHDIDVAQNGMIYVPTNKILTREYAEFPKIEPPILADYLAVLTPEGQVVKEFSLLDAFAHSPYRGLAARSMHANAFAGDYLHLNSVHVLTRELAPLFPQFEAGQVLMSFREANLLAVMDLRKNTIVWAMRGPWARQHYARFEKDGTIGLFDNMGVGYKGERYSRVLKIDPADGKIRWSSFQPEDPATHIYSMIRGSQQWLPNGNVFIDLAVGGKLIEMTPEKKVVWEYYMPYTVEPNSGNPLTFAKRFTYDDLPFLNLPAGAVQ